MTDLFVQGCEAMKLPLSEKTADSFMTYMRLLIQWNQNVNLTAITEPAEIITKHFLDSLTPVSEGLIKTNARVIDVGCGAGFPGLPIRLMREDVRLTLLDSLAKRLNFIQAVLDETGTQGVECVHARAEDGGVAPQLREKFDVAVSRAVANLAVLAEYCLPFVKTGGLFVALKGPSVDTELAGGTNAVAALGGKIEEIRKVPIPFTDLAHTMVIVRKLKPCPKGYPRKAGTPAKNPLS